MLDIKPVPVVGYKRDKCQSDFTASADYRWCTSRKMNYFGYKLVLISALAGIPLVYSLVPASTDERLAAESVLGCVHGCRIFADKGFIGGEWQSDICKTTGNQIFTPKRANQLQQQPKAIDKFIKQPA
ncbi:transposase [Nostoc sp. LPT]|uniref:transposase n=1 Tax=Nostoc sp. LPT TaxID=2815387 RepID=UPI0025D398CC|nr:transposase [Nostoc sp. LPT]